VKQILQNLKTGETLLAEVPAPRVMDGRVLVRSAASAVSAGTERSLVEFAGKSLLGKARSRPDLVRRVWAKARRDGVLAALETAQSRLEEPLPLGYSCAGTVEESGVSGFAPGDRVACAGGGYAGHAEFVCVPENLCVAVPKGVPEEEAAFAALGAVALHGLRLAEVRLGESVAVVGLGVLGQLAAQLARASGCRVFGVDVDAGRAELAGRLGCEAASARAGAEEAGSAFTGGRGFDAVLIAADGGSDDPVQLAAALARDRGVVVAVGAVGLKAPRDVFYRKELSLRVSRSYGPGRYDPSYEEGGLDYPFGYVRWTEKRNMEEFLRLLASGAVKVAPLITHRVPIAEGVKAYDVVLGKTGEASLGVVLTYEARPAASETRVVRRAPGGPIGAAHIAPGTPGSGTVPAGVGVLGAGSFASGVMLPIVAKSGARLTGIASPSGTKAAAAARRFGFAFSSSKDEEVLADQGTGAVLVLSRHGAHAAQARAALAAGKHVWVEKPLCMDKAELEALAEALGKASGRLTVGFNRRFAPYTLELRRALAGAPGPKSILIRVNAGPLPAGHWTLDPAEGGGRLLGEGCHFIDWACFIAGGRPSSVSCRALGKAEGEQDWSARLGFPDGSVADIVYTAQGDPAAGKERYEVHAGGLSAVLEDFRTLRIVSGGRVASRRAWLKADKGHAGLWEAFNKAVGGGPAPMSWEEIEATMRTVFAARESLRTGRDVAP